MPEIIVDKSTLVESDEINLSLHESKRAKAIKTKPKEIKGIENNSVLISNENDKFTSPFTPQMITLKHKYPTNHAKNSVHRIFSINFKFLRKSKYTPIDKETMEP